MLEMIKLSTCRMDSYIYMSLSVETGTVFQSVGDKEMTSERQKYGG